MSFQIFLMMLNRAGGSYNGTVNGKLFCMKIWKQNVDNEDNQKLIMGGIAFQILNLEIEMLPYVVFSEGYVSQSYTCQFRKGPHITIYSFKQDYQTVFLVQFQINLMGN